MWAGASRRSLWRNRLARSAVNRKVGGSSPPRDEAVFLEGRKGPVVWPVHNRRTEAKIRTPPRTLEKESSGRKQVAGNPEVLERVQRSECLLTRQRSFCLRVFVPG
ncbi:unnamed protein product, partial [Gulo gulo]